MHRIKVLFLVVLLDLLLFLPGHAYAILTPTPALDPGCIETELGCIHTDIPTFVSEYYQYGLGIIGGVAIIFIIIGGYIILTSRGDPHQLNNGKAYIGYAIAGLLLAIFGYVFVEVIAKDVLQIPGFT